MNLPGKVYCNKVNISELSALFNNKSLYFFQILYKINNFYKSVEKPADCNRRVSLRYCVPARLSYLRGLPLS